MKIKYILQTFTSMHPQYISLEVDINLYLLHVNTQNNNKLVEVKKQSCLQEHK